MQGQALATADRQTKRMRLRDIIAEKSLLKGEVIQLVSGVQSSFYFNMKPTAFDPEGLDLIADLILEELNVDAVDFIGGLEMGAVPVIVAVSLKSWEGQNITGFFVRKEAKAHGTQRLIEGIEAADLKGANVVLVDDVTTTGGSVFKAVAAARNEGAVVSKVITVVDRLEGATENMAKEGLQLVPLLTAKDFEL